MRNIILAGIIAGIISGIIANVAFIIANLLRAPMNIVVSGVLTSTFLTTHFIFELVVQGTFGAILAAIYSMYYDATPGKGVLKGLVYGLILYLIGGLYFGFLALVRYGLGECALTFALANWWMIFFCLVSYGLVLGALYERPARTIRRYDFRDGIIPGTIAGLVGGIVAIVSMIVGVNLRVWDPTHVIPGLLATSSFTTLHMFEIIVTIAFGAIFGAIFSMYYDSTPSKGIMKGLLFSLILYLIKDIRMGVIGAGYGYFNAAIAIFWIGFFTLTVYGLVIGVLYRKPTK